MKLRDILKDMKPAGMSENALVHIPILMYEIGDVAKCVFRASQSFEGCKDYKGDMKLAVADSMVQLAIIAEYFDLNIEECFEIGVVHMKERLLETKQKWEKTGLWE